MELIIIVYTSLLLIFLFLYLSARKKLVMFKEAFVKLYESNQLFKEAIEAKPTKEEEEIHKENFIKFLSDSREWAYDYIENVQEEIKSFIENVDPHLEYYKKYGSVVEGMVSPHDKALKTISNEIEKLKNLMPKEPND